jgi:formamidopyrimidine-DNA glycosylase
MGPEPLEARGLGSLIHKKSTGRKAPVKAFLMDQRTVVGVGNIYACEALFLAGIHPQTPAGSLDLGSYKEVSRHIKKVLKKAILQGGTSFRDFKHLDGKASGYFQIRLAVYNRKGQECKSCGEHIENVVIAGRSSFYCPRCQSL